MKDELKEQAKISLPVTVLNFVIFARGMVTYVFLGKLGSLELAGGALAMSFINITCAMIFGLASGMDPICSQAFGAQNLPLVGLTLQRTMFVLLLACIPIGIMWLNITQIYLFFNQDASIVATAGIFCFYALPDLLAESVLESLRVYLRCQGITQPLMLCSILALLLHIPLNIVIVSVFGFGVPGAAIAWTWTNFNLVIFIVMYTWFSGSCSKTWPGWSLVGLQELWPLLKISLPSCLAICLDWWWYEVITILAGYLANLKATIASAAILIQTTSIIYTFSLALSSTASTRVGHELGRNRPKFARFAAWVAMSCALISAIVSVIWTTLFRNMWGSIFTNDTDVLALTTTMVPLIGLCELGNSTQTTGCGVLRGSAKVEVAARINFICFYLLGTPIAVALAFWCNFEFSGLWFGLLTAQITCGFSMVYNILKIDWAQEAHKAQCLTGMALDDSSMKSIQSLESDIVNEKENLLTIEL